MPGLLPPLSPNHLIHITLHTLQQSVKHGEKGTAKEEIIKWFGIIILATNFEFGDRVSLWSNVYQSKYRSAPSFGKTGMSRYRFGILWRHVRWSHQPDVQYEGMSHEAHQWKLVEYFVTNFNEYRTHLISSSDLICDDKSI